MKKKLMMLMLIFSGGCTNTLVEKDSGPEAVSAKDLNVADAIPKYEKRTRAGNPDEYEIFGKRYKVLSQSKGYQKKGIASWYGTKFHGRKTANGETYNMYAMTAAHKTLPIPSYVRVTNQKNQRSAVVRINDRGPFHGDRIIDLSYAAATKLGIRQTGTGQVEVLALGFDSATATEVEQKITPRNKEVRTQSEVFYLQVGAFVRSDNATHLQKKLTTADLLSTRIDHTKNQHTELYKLQVGPLYSAQQAKQASEKLAQIGFDNSLLIIEKQ